MKSWARKQIEEATDGKANRNRRSAKDGHLERTLSDEPLGTRKVSYFDSQVRLRITHYRTRLADPGGASTKALIDGLVRGGILVDDSRKWIKEPINEVQIKVASRGEEKTVVEIEEVE